MNEEHGVHIFIPQTWQDEVRRHLPALRAAGAFCLLAWAVMVVWAWWA